MHADAGGASAAVTALYCDDYAQYLGDNTNPDTDNNLYGTVVTVTCDAGHFFADNTNVKTAECAEATGSNFIQWTDLNLGSCSRESLLLSFSSSVALSPE